MIEKLLVINIVALLGLGGVTISISLITLRKARGYVELAEKRMEALREGQARLARAMSRGQQSLREGAGRGRQSLSEQERRAQARQEIERRIEQLQQQLHELQEAQEDLKVREEAYAAGYEGALTDGSREWAPVDVLPEEAPGYRGEPQPPEEASERKGARRVRWHLHPDDDAWSSSKQGQARSAPMQMFRDHYDRYLENYEGYVKLAERLYSEMEAGDGALVEQDWEDRLRRLKDGIKRTTSRLDILEQYNPELASDDRISRRASISKTYADLGERLREAGRF